MGICSILALLMALGCSEEQPKTQILRYGVKGFEIPDGPRGFDYKLGKYRIGEREKDGPKFTEHIDGDGLFDTTYVFLPDGFIDRVICMADSKEKAQDKDTIDTLIEDLKTKYEKRYGFSFRNRDERGSKEGSHLVAIIDPTLNTTFHIYSVRHSKYTDKYFLCMGINALDCISNSVVEAENKGYMKRGTLLDLRLGDDCIGRAQTKECVEYKLKKPIRYFTKGRSWARSGRVYAIELLGFLDDLAQESGQHPVENYKNIAVEHKALLKLYTEKYGLKFDKQIDKSGFWETSTKPTAYVNPKIFPEVTLTVSGRESMRGGIDEYDVKLILNASDIMYLEAEKEESLKASQKAMPLDKDVDKL